MKLFLAIVCFAAPLATSSALTSEFKIQILDTITVCRRSYKIEMSEIEVAVKQKKVPDSRDAKCLLACVMKDIGVISGGKFFPEAALILHEMKYEDPEIVEKGNAIAHKCMDEIPLMDDDCELAAVIVDCMVKYADEAKILPEDFDD